MILWLLTKKLKSYGKTREFQKLRQPALWSTGRKHRKDYSGWRKRGKSKELIRFGFGNQTLAAGLIQPIRAVINEHVVIYIRCGERKTVKFQIRCAGCVENYFDIFAKCQEKYNEASWICLWSHSIRESPSWNR